MKGNSLFDLFDLARVQHPDFSVDALVTAPGFVVSDAEREANVFDFQVALAELPTQVRKWSSFVIDRGGLLLLRRDFDNPGANRLIGRRYRSLICGYDGEGPRLSAKLIASFAGIPEPQLTETLTTHTRVVAIDLVGASHATIYSVR